MDATQKNPKEYSIINSVRLVEGSIVKDETMEEESTINDTSLDNVDPVNT